MIHGRHFLCSVTTGIIFSALLVVIDGCNPKANNEVLKATIKRNAEDAYNNGNIDALDEHCTQDYFRHNPPNSDIAGLAAFKENVKNTRVRLPDCRLTIDEIIIDGNYGSMLWSFQGTFSDNAPGTAAIAGKRLHETGCSFFRMESGMIAEEWMFVDDRGVQQQLGYKIQPPITKSTFALVTEAQLKPGKIENLVKLEKEMWVPLFQSYEEFRGFFFMSDEKTGKVCSISIWDNEDATKKIMQSDEVNDCWNNFVIKTKDFFVVKPGRKEFHVAIQE